jgi:hypothetical protein
MAILLVSLAMITVRFAIYKQQSCLSAIYSGCERQVAMAEGCWYNQSPPTKQAIRSIGQIA